MEDAISRNKTIQTILSLTNFGSVDALMKYAGNPIRAKGWIGGIADAIKVIQEAETVADEERGGSG